MSSCYLHVDLDAFFASVEQLDNPEYRGKAVIVGGLPSDKRAVVSTCSYEARKYGVHSAMPIFKAYKLCPNGIYLRGRMERYHEKSKEVMKIFYDFSPDVKQMSVDEAFIDITGTEMLFGSPEEVAKKLKEQKVEAEVINARFIKPFDKETVKKSISKTKKVITFEDNALIGGLGSEVKEIISSEQEIQNIEIKTYGIEDEFMGYATWEDIFTTIQEQIKPKKEEK